MKVKITLNDINSFGEAWDKIRDMTYGKQTVKIYRALRPFMELAEDFRKATTSYIKENSESGQKIDRYESVLDPEGNEMTDEVKAKLGMPESDEWKGYQSWVYEQMTDDYEFEVTPILEDNQANKLNPNQIRIFDRLGLLVEPKSTGEDNE